MDLITSTVLHCITAAIWWQHFLHMLKFIRYQAKQEGGLIKHHAPYPMSHVTCMTSDGEMIGASLVSAEDLSNGMDVNTGGLSSLVVSIAGSPLSSLKLKRTKGGVNKVIKSLNVINTVMMMVR